MDESAPQTQAIEITCYCVCMCECVCICVCVCVCVNISFLTSDVSFAGLVLHMEVEDLC